MSSRTSAHGTSNASPLDAHVARNVEDVKPAEHVHAVPDRRIPLQRATKRRGEVDDAPHVMLAHGRREPIFVLHVARHVHQLADHVGHERVIRLAATDHHAPTVVDQPTHGVRANSPEPTSDQNGHAGTADMPSRT